MWLNSKGWEQDQPRETGESAIERPARINGSRKSNLELSAGGTCRGRAKGGQQLPTRMQSGARGIGALQFATMVQSGARGGNGGEWCISSLLGTLQAEGEIERMTGGYPATLCFWLGSR